jgi:hypothetical protein
MVSISGATAIDYTHAHMERAAPKRRDLPLLLLAWLGLAAVLTFFALRNLEAPGLNYDEAVYGHLTKDFLLGHAAGQRMPGSRVVSLLGHPFPLFVQDYLGALKCWMLLPGFALFGTSMAVMRLTMLAWTLAGLLFFMLGTRRLLGLRAGVAGGFLLGLDPAFYFISVCEWGSVVPSFVCRLAAFFFALRWWQDQKDRQERRARDLFLAGLACGLGFFNKIDFLLILGGCGAALAAVCGPGLWRELRRRPAHLAWGAAGLLPGVGLMALSFLHIAGTMLRGGSSGAGGQALEKASTLRAMFDGSYFYRLMEHGGDFSRMFSAPVPVWSPFGLLFALAFALLAAVAVRGWRRHAPERVAAFLVLSTVLVLLATWLLPGAIRIHHWTLVYPLPHLVILTAAAWLAQRSRILAVLAVAVVFCCNLLVIEKTERLIADTGGRGLWSNALNAFAAAVRTRSDLTLVSYDWGFYEQLAFLTDGPRLVEPVWSMLGGDRSGVPAGPEVIYLVHPPESQVFPFGSELLERAARMDPRKAAVRKYTDRQGRPAFYAVRFFGEPGRIE